MDLTLEPMVGLTTHEESPLSIRFGMTMEEVEAALTERQIEHSGSVRGNRLVVMQLAAVLDFERDRLVLIEIMRKHAGQVGKAGKKVDPSAPDPPPGPLVTEPMIGGVAIFTQPMGKVVGALRKLPGFGAVTSGHQNRVFLDVQTLLTIRNPAHHPRLCPTDVIAIAKPGYWKPRDVPDL